ncbi:hypothetical protein H6G32_09885 [Cylindrospermum sp. FACHB-282]|nr:hypothetical protein [Cylindrospermum sp. FACHB-282]
MRTLKFLLRSHLIRSGVVQQVGGFTLIELLVGMVMAVLVITPLLGFMIDIMKTDQQEQAKANSEQEIQAALDYISRDLQQAIYIYDSAGIDAIKTELPNPTATDRVPVLVFWKRELVNQAITNADNTLDDSFVYSLVAYYLIQDTNPNPTWSKAARIARWQIKDGVLATTGGVPCTGYPDKKYVNSANCPSSGFALFNLDGVGAIDEKMKAWKKASEIYTTDAAVLVDFIDQTKNDATPAAPAATCPSSPATWSQISPPASFAALNPNTSKMTSFYGCINKTADVTDVTAIRVFLRGNALARIENDESKINYVDSKKTYFPNASIQVQSRGYLYTK